MKPQVEVLILRWIFWGPRYQPLKVQIPGNTQLLKWKHLPSKACLNRWCSGLPLWCSFLRLGSNFLRSWHFLVGMIMKASVYLPVWHLKHVKIWLCLTLNPMVLLGFFWRARKCLTIHFRTPTLGLSHSRGAENHGGSKKESPQC